MRAIVILFCCEVVLEVGVFELVDRTDLPEDSPLLVCVLEKGHQAPGEFAGDGEI
ncbi:hypothetical protein [Kribbella catacumbae]|uniref:hypothetical protein n=1 Tax=Kribbella catacumbae TaxID=460086 RepID=UPI00036D0996|nr:hypothetical protein [Kribbella catacumbae]